MKKKEFPERTLTGTLRDEIDQLEQGQLEELRHRSVGVDLAGLCQVSLPSAEVSLGGGEQISDLGLIQAEGFPALSERLSERQRLACHALRLIRREHPP